MSHSIGNRRGLLFRRRCGVFKLSPGVRGLLNGSSRWFGVITTKASRAAHYSPSFWLVERLGAQKREREPPLSSPSPLSLLLFLSRLPLTEKSSRNGSDITDTIPGASPGNNCTHSAGGNAFKRNKSSFLNTCVAAPRTNSTCRI